MKRILTLAAAALALVLARPALADDADAAKDADATRAADDALADKADVPAKPPTLPTTASDRASYVHDNIAFGKKGAAERATHGQADKQGRADTDDAHADAANRAAHGAAASAAASANGDSHAAAGHARANSARDTHSQPAGTPPVTMPVPATVHGR
ncbi:hypothetical protein [Anaeromyxobacter oryzae]|uniref:Uncharacterized protein n=1 Tax=Anaeromyxobacter oryzae TaxID=2918170 RepID=A0ABN6MUU6_9BACT|nr:hypothetical protein [Anaeromyxobacter oryzae]BDG03622.1 hypothetical protein AMOR_26180 [Anaeromyxobacter oryzae]